MKILLYKIYKKMWILICKFYLSMFKYKEVNLQIIALEDYDAHTYIRLAPARIEKFNINKVYKVIEGGNISIHSPSIRLMKFQDAVFSPKSDIIQVNGQAFWDKFHQTVFEKIIPLDKDLKSFDKKRNNVCIYRKKSASTLKIKNAFSLCGVHANHWGHFLFVFLPKLESLKYFSEIDQITIVLPETNDIQIKEAVEKICKEFSCFNFLYVQEADEVECECLYYCTSPNYLSDHGKQQILFDLQPTRYGLECLNSLRQRLVHSEKSHLKRRIYLPHSGSRMLKNSAALSLFFERNGFQIVVPENMTLSEKISLFSTASHIVSPGGSGLHNILFCMPGTKILALGQLQGPQVMFASICDTLGLDFHTVIGVSDATANVHKAYEVRTEMINDFFESSSFLR